MLAAILVAIISVIAAALLGSLGWFIRYKIDEGKALKKVITELRDHMLTSRQTDITMETDVAQLMRLMPQVKETLAVVVAEFENHQMWHERQGR